MIVWSNDVGRSNIENSRLAAHPQLTVQLHFQRSYLRFGGRRELGISARMPALMRCGWHRNSLRLASDEDRLFLFRCLYHIFHPARLLAFLNLHQLFFVHQYPVVYDAHVTETKGDQASKDFSSSRACPLTFWASHKSFPYFDMTAG